jgi:alpha-tubulin suppressor-like RCC1 family protein
MVDPKLHRPSLGNPGILGLLAVLAAGGCGDNGPGEPDPDPPRADSIALSRDSIFFDAIGETIQITASVFDQYGDPMPTFTVVWASDNSNVVSVDQTGTVTSAGDGTTQIRAQASAKRASAKAVVNQEADILALLGGNDQRHWTGFLLPDPLVVKLTDAAGTPVVGEIVTWEVLDGDGTLTPEAPQTDVEGEVTARWRLGTGEGGIQRVSAKVGQLDPVTFEATGSPPIKLLNADPLTGPMLDTLTTTLMTLDSLGVPQSGIPLEFQGYTGFGEFLQGPTSTDINAQLDAGWILGPTPGPQEMTVARGDIDAELKLVAVATGTLDPWPFTSVSPGFDHTCAVQNDGDLFCWGTNETSQLAQEDTLPALAPVNVESGLNWNEVATGEFHSCGLSTAWGTIACWGQGPQTGQLGDSTQLVPTPAIVAGGPWKALAAGGFHTCALTEAGAAWCWGDELEGRLGNGSLEPTEIPTPVNGGLTFDQISGGHFHTCGLTPEGEAYCWGRGTEGQLGDGGLSNRGAPVKVAGGITWAKISSGRFHSCGISTDGEAFCWGEGGFNQLGNGVSVSQTSPVKVAGGHSWGDITAGQVHSCGVTETKKLYCWGAPGFVGLGEFGSPVPAVVLPPFNWRSVRTSGLHTCSISLAFETFCWGPNDFGQLGFGKTGDTLIPRILVRGVLDP